MKFDRKPLSLATTLIATAGLAATNIAYSAGELEEIVVTATKRAESVQDVSIPLTAVSGEQLE
ncbi:hypothetical protein OAL10_09775, partial [Gammaproteobacteria bacterium]|nr:hypothetical protein [Gammaproteobacteria bacterium]